MHLILWGKSPFRYIRLGYNGGLLYLYICMCFLPLYFTKVSYFLFLFYYGDIFRVLVFKSKATVNVYLRKKKLKFALYFL